MIGIIKLILLILIPILVMVFSLLYIKSRDNEKEDKELLSIRRRVSIDKMMAENKSFIGKYFNNTKLFLSQYGFYYMFGTIHPAQYILIRIVFGALFGIVAITANAPLMVTIMSAILGYCFPNIMLKLSNKQDNENMLRDLKNIYETMKIQTRAGVYLTTVLSECYKIVYCKRLKVALLELTKSISATNDIEAALDSLTIKFKSKYIDIFAMIVTQSLQSGQSLQLLEDITSQLVDLENALLVKEKGRLDLKIQMIELMIVIGIIAITIYALFIYMGATLSGL